MTISEIYALLNDENSIDNLYCLNDIVTEEDRIRLNAQGYNFAFTRDQWQAKYPSLPAKYIFCGKQQITPATLIYFNPKKYIYFQLWICGDKYLRNDKPFEKVTEDQLRYLENAYDERDYAKLLSAAFSEQSGNIVLHLANLMLENEPPSEQLYRTFFDFYTEVDCGCHNLSAKAVKRLLRCKNEAMTEKTRNEIAKYLNVKSLNPDDTIRIYRGHGSKSTSWSRAFSWTLDLNTAYFFASWKGGEAASVIEAEVKVKDVIEFLQDRSEAEIFVPPNVVKGLKIDQCVHLDDFLREVSAPWRDVNFFSLRDRVKVLYAEAGQPSHDAEHTIRVALFGEYLLDMVLSGRKKLPYGLLRRDYSKKAKWMALLITSIVYHDIGRTTDFEDESHGIRGYEIYQKQNEDNDVIRFLVSFHCKEDTEAKEYYDLNFGLDPDKNIIWILFQILKDADALDRWRFGYRSADSLDVKMLRLKESRSLCPVAATLQRYKI